MKDKFYELVDEMRDTFNDYTRTNGSKPALAIYLSRSFYRDLLNAEDWPEFGPESFALNPPQRTVLTHPFFVVDDGVHPDYRVVIA